MLAKNKEIICTEDAEQLLLEEVSYELEF